MLQILALLFGVCSWTILIYSIIKSKNTKVCINELRFLSWVFCAIALYIPSLCQLLEFKAGDFDSVIDCVTTYHLASAFLLFITVVLTIISILLQKKDK